MLFDVFLGITNYLFGSFLFAIHLPRIMNFKDPRSYGSQNPGSTNAFRQNSSLGLWVFIGDLCKGMLAGQLAFFGSTITAQGMIGFACFLGHIFPIFHKFKGGKGIATGVGLCFSMCPVAGITGLTSWFITLFLFRKVALASVTASFIVTYIAIYQNNPYSFMVLLMLFCSVLKHFPNMVKLFEFK